MNKEQAENLSIEIQRQAVESYRYFSFNNADDTAEVESLVVSKAKAWTDSHKEFVHGVVLGVTKGGELSKSALASVAAIVIRQLFSAIISGKE